MCCSSTLQELFLLPTTLGTEAKRDCVQIQLIRCYRIGHPHHRRIASSPLLSSPAGKSCQSRFSSFPVTHKCNSYPTRHILHRRHDPPIRGQSYWLCSHEVSVLLYEYLLISSWWPEMTCWLNYLPLLLLLMMVHPPPQRHSGRCTQHVLLDPLDVHGGGRVYEKARLRSAIPGRGQLPEPGQCHYQAYEILSMGGVHAVFSGE